MTDLKLCMDWTLLPLTPFYYFVAPEPFPFRGPKLFHRFMHLPLELHRMIFQYCDTPTLFHLMHTSSYIRRECLDLFWEPEHNTWYRPKFAEEMFRCENHEGFHCPEFSSRVTQVEIGLGDIDLGPEPEDKRTFWVKLQRLFPSTRRVVLTCEDERRSALITPEYYSSISNLVALAPSNITPFIAFDSCKDGDPPCFTLWGVGAEDRWRVFENPWTPMRVIIPPRKFPPGLLNDVLFMDRNREAYYCEERAIDWLIWETHARYADYNGIDCPDSECHANFRTLEGFKAHFRHILHHGSYSQYPDIRNVTTCHRNTPAEVRAALDTKKRRSYEMRLITDALKYGLSKQYHKHGAPGKRQFEETLASQLKENGLFVSPDGSLYNSIVWDLMEDYFIPGPYDYPDHPDEADNAFEERFLPEREEWSHPDD